jgi:hypothetical protein
VPRLTILNHWQGDVAIAIDDDDPVTLAPGERLERTLNGPVQLGASATGRFAGLIRPGTVADGLVQDRVLVVEVPDPNRAELTFRVT